MKHNNLTVGQLKVAIYPTAKDAGLAAAQYTANLLQELGRDRETIGVIFATGASQLAVLEALVARDDVPWQKIVGFHLDEYVGISAADPGSFRYYLLRHLTSLVPIREFHSIEGDAGNLSAACERYTQLLHSVRPEICLMGIGENGHLAFNDPGVADFEDTVDMKVVDLDQTCRQQQAAEGWFRELDLVPRQAITLTIPAILRVPHLLVSVPGERKAAIVRRALEEPTSTDCPATILREHEGANLYLDAASAALWESDRATLRVGI